MEETKSDQISGGANQNDLQFDKKSSEGNQIRIALNPQKITSAPGSITSSSASLFNNMSINTL